MTNLVCMCVLLHYQYDVTTSERSEREQYQYIYEEFINIYKLSWTLI